MLNERYNEEDGEVGGSVCVLDCRSFCDITFICASLCPNDVVWAGYEPVSRSRAPLPGIPLGNLHGRECDVQYVGVTRNLGVFVYCGEVR